MSTATRRRPRLGRPPLPDGERRSTIYRVRLTDAEADRLRSLAEQGECDGAEVLRRALAAYSVAR